MVETFLRFIERTFTFNIGKMEIAPTYWQAGAIIFLLFLLLMTFARVRYLYVNWSLGKSAIAMLFWGFLLAIIFEGFMLIAGKTLFTEIFGWQNAPKPISAFIDLGRDRLYNSVCKR